MCHLFCNNWKCDWILNIGANETNSETSTVFFFFLGGGGTQLQCIYYLVTYTDL